MNLFEPWQLPIGCYICTNLRQFTPPRKPFGFSLDVMNPSPSEYHEVMEELKKDASLATMPEDGDAFANISQTTEMKKNNGLTIKELKINTEHSLASIQMSHCPLLRLSNNLSNCIINTALYSHMELVELGVLGCETQPDLLNVESTGFPYYRSNKTSGGFQDIVLVKDAGISCTLLSPDIKTSKSGSRGSALMERFLIKQLKIECSDISEITKKISTYTKDILKSLSLRKNKSAEVLIDDPQLPKVEFNPVAIHYNDQTGQPCLKLRLVKSTKFSTSTDFRQNLCWSFATSRRNSKIKNTTNNANTKLTMSQQMQKTRNQRDTLISKQQRMENRNRLQHSELMQAQIRDHKFNKSSWWHSKQVRQLYPKEPTPVELESSTYSSSSIYDFLMLRNRRILVKEKEEKVRSPEFQNNGAPDWLNKCRFRKSCTPKTNECIQIKSYGDYNTMNKLSTSQKNHRAPHFRKKCKATKHRSWISVVVDDSRCLSTSESQAVDIHIMKHKHQT